MFFGLLLILLGGTLLASELLALSFWTVCRLYWPVLLILYGLAQLFRAKSKWFGLCFIAVGGILQATTLGVLNGSAWTVLLSILLILLGLRFVIRPNNFDGTDGSDPRFSNQQSRVYPAGQQVRHVERDLLDESFSFTSAHRVYHSKTFSGGEVRSSFSSVHLDLRDVWPLEEETHLNVSIRFGELEIAIPADWHCIVNGKHCYAHAEKEHPESDAAEGAAHTLVVDSSVFAGVLRIL